MKNIYLFQPQYTSKYDGKLTCWLPYSVGCIWSYAAQFEDIKENYQLADIIFRREDHEDILDRMHNPSVCAFSCYAWNYQYIIALAEKIKTQWPNCRILFGGPHVTTSTLNYKFVDSIVLAEGELNFVNFLRHNLNNSIEEIYTKLRLDDLKIPSPYVTGVFDNIIQQNPNIVWSMTLETNRGCPYSCTFCDWGSAVYAKVKKFGLEKIALELDWAATHQVDYLEIADANFGIFKDRDIEIAKLIRVAANAPTSILKNVRANFLKNGSEYAFRIIEILGGLSRNGVTLSVQSMNADTLTEIKRDNMEINEISTMLKLSEEYNIPTYSELILGLPEETLESWKAGLAELLEAGQHQSLDVWYAQLLPNSELAQPLSMQKHGIKTVMTVDYMNQWQSIDGNDYPEIMEIVKETNTMTTDDIIDAYMYSWLIIQLHITGYTQLFSKYCRYVKNISYRTFYDLLLTAIQLDTILGKHYQEVKQTTKSYFNDGILINQEKILGNGIHAMSYEYLFNNREMVNQFALNFVRQLTDIPDSIAELQNHFVYNENSVYPVTVLSDYNVRTWEKNKTIYQIENNISKGNYHNIYAIRRKGLIKNKFTQLDSTTT
jgi:radical SAM superfamily enzyme YgiQ (UPF0313 family)